MAAARRCLSEARPHIFGSRSLGEAGKQAEKSGARRASPTDGGRVARVVTIEGPVDRPKYEDTSEQAKRTSKASNRRDQPKVSSAQIPRLGLHTGEMHPSPVPGDGPC